MTVSEYVKSWIREHQQTSNRSAVEEKQTKVSGEEGIREDQPYSVNAMSVICSQTTVSGEGGIREDRAHTAKGKRTMVRDYVEAGRLENQPPSINAICVYTAQVYKARVKQQPGKARYDTDSKLIRIDNCASYSISFDKNDFITPLKPVRQKVKGLGGVLDGLQTGTIEWTIEDDEGMPYVIKLPGSLYVPNSPSRLLSPNTGLRQLQETNHGVRLITMKSGYFGTVDRGRKPQSYPSKQGMWQQYTQPQDTKPITVSWKRQASRNMKIWLFSVRMWSQMMKPAKMKMKQGNQVGKA